jgi:hypothetical protein
MVTNHFVTFSFNTELRTSHPGLLQLLDKLTNVRGMVRDGDREAFFVFFDILVPAVAGRKIWTPRQKAVRLISESKKIVSVLDEAFTILALENYWARWHEGATARWTDSRSGNYQYMGWADAAYTRFDQLCTLLQAQRQTEINIELEKAFLARARVQLAGGGTPLERPIGQAARGVEVYNELDDEED